MVLNTSLYIYLCLQSQIFHVSKLHCLKIVLYENTQLILKTHEESYKNCMRLKSLKLLRITNIKIYIVIFIKTIADVSDFRFRHGLSPVILLHIFRTPFPKNISERLLLVAAYKVKQSLVSYFN